MIGCLIWLWASKAHPLSTHYSKYFGDELKVNVASYHHILDIGTSDHRDRKRYYAYNVPSPLLDYFDKKHCLQKDPGVQYVFSKGHFVWLSDMMLSKTNLSKIRNY